MIKQPTRIKQGQNWLEPSLIILAFFCLFVLLATFVPSAPNSSDVELYFEIGLKGTRDTFVLNRYFHIYLQRIFILLAGNPLKGFQVFWAFLMAATSTLTFLLARKVSNSNSVLIGLLGVAFFWAVQVHIELAGNPLVDFTAMALATATAVVYLYSIQESSRQKWLLILLGMLVFFGFKSKETTLPVSMTILLLGWHEGCLNLSQWWKKIRFVLIGLLIAVLIFFVLNSVFIKDPLFGFRPTEFLRFFNTYVPKTALTYEQDPYSNWYYSFWLRLVLIPFIFYILSGVSAGNNKTLPFRIIWLTPLAVIIFLILSINNFYGFNPRFSLPAVAILCGLAPQILDSQLFEMSQQNRSKRFRFDLLPIGIAGFLLLIILIWGRSSKVDLVNIYNLMLLPALLTFMLGLIFWNKDQPLFRVAILTALIIALFFPVYRNIKEIIFVRENHNNFLETVSPFTQFQDKVKATPDMLYCIETRVFSNRPIAFAKNVDELYSLYDIVTNSNTTRDNFHFETIANSLVKFEGETPLCTFILIPNNLQDELEGMPNFGQKLTANYESTKSPKGDLLLYSKR